MREKIVGGHLQLVHSVKVPKVTTLTPKSEGDPDAYLRALEQVRRDLEMGEEGPIDTTRITGGYDPSNT